MAVANTVTQIVLPGIDKVVQDQTVAALAVNPTVAAIITNLANQGSTAALNTAIAGKCCSCRTSFRKPFTNICNLFMQRQQTILEYL